MKLRNLALSILIAVLLFAITVWAMGRRREPHPAPIPPQADLKPGSTIRSAKGRILFHDFRSVESPVLFRAGGFNPGNVFEDESAFDFLRSRNIKHIVALQENAESFYAEEGYLRYWAARTGYHIQATWIPVRDENLFARDHQGGLHAAAEFLSLMKYPPQDSAVLIHDDGTGRDATGVVVAAYELARNWGWVEPETLWSQIMERYSVAGADGSELESIRKDLDTLAEL